VSKAITGESPTVLLAERQRYEGENNGRAFLMKLQNAGELP